MRAGFRLPAGVGPRHRRARHRCRRCSARAPSHRRSPAAPAKKSFAPSRGDRDRPAPACRPRRSQDPESLPPRPVERRQSCSPWLFSRSEARRQPNAEGRFPPRREAAARAPASRRSGAPADRPRSGVRRRPLRSRPARIRPRPRRGVSLRHPRWNSMSRGRSPRIPGPRSAGSWSSVQSTSRPASNGVPRVRSKSG